MGWETQPLRLPLPILFVKFHQERLPALGGQKNSCQLSVVSSCRLSVRKSRESEFPPTEEWRGWETPPANAECLCF